MNSQGSWTWGDAANFLSSTPIGASARLAAQQSQQIRLVSASGWALIRQPENPPEIVAAAEAKGVAVMPLGVDRPDVAA